MKGKYYILLQQYYILRFTHILTIITTIVMVYLFFL